MRTVRHKLHQPRVGSAIGAVLGVISGVLFFFSIFGEQLEHLSFDLPFMLFREPGKRDDVVIVKLDDASYSALNQNGYLFNGTNHAQLVRRLKDEGASVVAFDILFIDQNPPPPGDAEFAAAMRDYGKVVLAGNVLQKKIDRAVQTEAVTPRAALEEAAAGWGVAKIAAPAGTAVRQQYQGTERFPSLAWKAAEVAGLPVARDPEQRRRARWLNYYGPEPFVQIPYYQLLDPNFKLPVSLRGCGVFVGRSESAGYAGEQKDEFIYPWTPLNGRAPFGVEFHALAFSNLFHKDWQQRIPFWLELTVVLALGGGLGWLLPRWRPLPAVGASLGVALGVVALGCLCQLRWNLWFGWMTPFAIQIPLVLVWGILFHSIRSYFEAEFLNRSLALYLSPGQVQQILKRPELLKPGVEQREVSILFSDIAGFSKISERMLPEDLARLLNDYYETTISSVHETGGTVVNLIGDAILAVWNAPQGQDDHRERACRAATLLGEKLIVFDASQQNLRLKTRIGLHTGIASVGNIGSSSHFDYAVIGENVNLASRLEGLNKYLGTSILATRPIQKSVEKQIVNRFVGHFRFKGLDQVTEIYELLLSDGQKPPGGEWLQPFAQGIHFFQRAGFAEAEKHFRSVLALKAGDGPSEFYLKKIEEFSTHPPKAEWMGEIDLGDK